MAVIGLFIPFLFIGLIVLFILVTVGNREFIPPIAQYGALSSPILTAVVTIIGVVSVLFGNYVSVDLDIAPLMPSFDIPGTQVVGPAATIVSAVALSATYPESTDGQGERLLSVGQGYRVPPRAAGHGRAAGSDRLFHGLSSVRGGRGCRVQIGTGRSCGAWTAA